MTVARMHRALPCACRGFSMLEMLVTLLILTLWLLGTAGVQSSSLRLTKTAQFRTYAILLASDISERMESNKLAAVAGRYTFSLAAGDAPPSSDDCTQIKCSSSQLATFDLSDWATRAQSLLPNAALTVVADANTPINYAITIQWADRSASKTATSATETMAYTTNKSVFNDAM